ncbi:polysaccharide biosynthesis protein [Rhodocyclus gracilis]|uniref:polysaccharide biosynthesis protein n=1 Tax=Rhodocyclus gracilis TaxID=2929842 RepID=UPI001E2BCABF|nr:nucleoside-diphosphate sugar epimerase/dehydratase [Rhodocyclus gracilis]
MNRFFALPRRSKQIIAVSVDFILLLFAFWSAVVLRFDSLTPPLQVYHWMVLAAPLTAIPVFIRLGLYRAVIRFMEDRVVYVVFLGVTLSVLGLTAFVAFQHILGVSRGVLVIYWLLAILYVGASRFLARSYFLNAERQLAGRKRVAIYGAGRAGTQLAFALRAGRDYLPVAFFDDKAELQRTELAGLRVYAPEEIAEVLATKGVTEILLAVPSASRARRAEILALLEPFPCALKIVPGMADIVSGSVTVDALRPVDIEDLLGREAVAPDARLLAACITGKSVLVSGAGGSIGAELCRQIVTQRPQRLVLLELSEFALYAIDQELRPLAVRAGIELVPVLGSVLHQRRNELLMRSYGVETVYHAAAYKHVPLVEHNPVEGLRNNAIGTRRLAEAAAAAGVQTFVLISTDKAVRPTNIMGASKRLAELILQALARQGGSTRFCMVRFGNVLGSSGSVVPLFRKQIESGGPITLTHPDITRFFMTIPEAAQLVIQAGAMAQGGEVFVLDMGKPVRILDLAKRMVRLSGLEVIDEQHPNGDIAIDIVGLRPGEKLYEELLIGDNVEGTTHPLIMRAFEHELPWSELIERLQAMDDACRRFDYADAMSLLRGAVCEYTPGHQGEAELLWRRLERSASTMSTSALH